MKLATARPRTVTGERVVTQEGGFNPTWQRHAATYELCAPLLPQGRILDLGCGIGHSYHLLAPRESVGVDIDPDVLAGQDRPTAVADMRSLPFADHEFDGVISVQSLEHVPDPERVLAEAGRVIRPGGTAVFVTPNRLTFARPEEIIDPYHFVEFSPAELEAICHRSFEDVVIRGLFGSERYMQFFEAERVKLDALLRRDPLRLRRLVPRGGRQRLYDWMLSRHRADDDPAAAQITTEDFRLRDEALEQSLDLVAACSTSP